ncbi:MAG: hypothetical protein JNM76_00755 [Betaproteobacteria bacterium]|nr:hypothetical protein [Betaproteobacteria bacterium]
MQLRSLSPILFIACLVCGNLFAQPVQRSAEGKIAETYIKKVMAANGANAPVPVPTAAEVAALKSFNARVNDKDELEIKNWPPTALNTVKSVGQLNGIMGQLENTGIYKTRAEANARDATRKEQLAQVKTRSESLGQTGALAKDVRITLSPDEQIVMRRHGFSFDETNHIVAGGKPYALGDITAEQLADLSESGKKKYGEAYAKGAEAVELKLANPKLSFVERSQLEGAKKERDAVIAQTEKLLGGLRQKQAAIDAAGQPAPKKK